MLTRLLLILAAAAPLGARASSPRQLWDEKCASCHAPDGSGNTKTGRRLHIKDYTDPKVQAGFSDAGLLKNFLLGVADEDGNYRMPAYKDKVSVEDAKELVALIRSFKK